MDLAETLLQARWPVLAGTEAPVPVPFLVGLLFWRTIAFASFGSAALRNAMVLAVLCACALCRGAAVSLVLEMDGPLDGLLRVSIEPWH